MGTTAGNINAKPDKQWTFLNNHAHTLVCLARNPNALMREVAELVGITERAIQLIVKDLVESGVVVRFRVGRNNTYRVNPHYHLRHPLESDHTIEELLSMLLSEKEMTQLKNDWLETE